MSHKVILTGTHTGDNDAETLTDSGASFTVDGLIGMRIDNLTDGSSAVISDNDGTTVTADLAGGDNDNWTSGDSYQIVYNPFAHRLQKVLVPSVRAHMTIEAARAAAYIEVLFENTDNQCFVFVSKANRDAAPEVVV